MECPFKISFVPLCSRENTNKTIHLVGASAATTATNLDATWALNTTTTSAAATWMLSNTTAAAIWVLQ